MLRVDLMMRATESRVTERGTNDLTPAYASNHLFLEASIIPLEEVVRQGDRVKGFRIRQTISQTWIGEFGRGYFQQGIWMDADLTKFFSRLFLPVNKKTYPYYPYQCRYKTVCQSVIGLDPDSRAKAVPLLQRSLDFLLPGNGTDPGGDEERHLLGADADLPGAEGQDPSGMVRGVGSYSRGSLPQRVRDEGVSH